MLAADTKRYKHVPGMPFAGGIQPRPRHARVRRKCAARGFEWLAVLNSVESGGPPRAIP